LAKELVEGSYADKLNVLFRTGSCAMNTDIAAVWCSPKSLDSIYFVQFGRYLWRRLKGCLMPRQPKKEPTYLTTQEVWALMKRYSTRSGIPVEKAHPHALKHSSVTHLVSILHGDILAIQDHVGHADARRCAMCAP
jgi:integrase